MHLRIPFFLALRLSVQRFQMPLEGLSFFENVANIWNYLRNRPNSRASRSFQLFISTFGGTFGEFKAITPYPEQRARFENISFKVILFYAGNLKI